MSLIAAAAVSIVCGLAIMASTVDLVWRGWLPVPFGDQWQQLVSEHNVSWYWLISMHNEHRILLPRLVFVLDRLVSRERNIIDLAANVLMQTAFVGLLLDVLIRWRMKSIAANMLLVGLAICMAFWSVQWENFIWGFQVQIFEALLGTTFVAHQVAFGGRSMLSVIGTLVAMICTALTLSTGFLAAVVAVPLAWLVGRARRDIVIFSLAAIGLFALAITGLGRGGPEGGLTEDLSRHLPQIVAYALVDLGGPIGEALPALPIADNVTVAFCAGLVGLVLLAISGRRFASSPPSDCAAMLSALAVYGVLTAGITALGRWSLGSAQAMSSRYATPVLAFWIALCFLLQMQVQTPRLGYRWRVVAWTLPIGLLGLAVVSQRNFIGVAALTINTRAEAMPALAAGVADPTAMDDSGMVGPDPLAHVDALKASRVSLFASTWLGWFSSRLVDHAGVSDPSRCAGQIDQVRSVAIGLHGGSRVLGTVRTAGTTWLVRLILTDEAGMIVGFGVAPPFRMIEPDGTSTWTGAVATQPPGKLTVYALLGDGTACHLSGTPGEPG